MIDGRYPSWQRWRVVRLHAASLGSSSHLVRRPGIIKQAVPICGSYEGKVPGRPGFHVLSISRILPSRRLRPELFTSGQAQSRDSAQSKLGPMRDHG